MSNTYDEIQKDLDSMLTGEDEKPQFTMASLNSKRKNVLQNMCKERGLDTSGTKKALVGRLLANIDLKPMTINSKITFVKEDEVDGTEGATGERI